MCAPYWAHNTKPLWWQNTLALMKVDLIYKPCGGNVMSDVLGKHEEFQAISIIQFLWLIYNS
jgi:hypothetical protein